MKNTTAFVVCLLVIGAFARPLKPAKALKQTLFTEVIFSQNRANFCIDRHRRFW